MKITVEECNKEYYLKESERLNSKYNKEVKIILASFGIGLIVGVIVGIGLLNLS